MRIPKILARATRKKKGILGVECYIPVNSNCNILINMPLCVHELLVRNAWQWCIGAWDSPPSRLGLNIMFDIVIFGQSVLSLAKPEGISSY